MSGRAEQTRWWHWAIVAVACALTVLVVGVLGGGR
jgi:hypothetical protein